MAFTKKLPSEVTNEIARQVGQHFEPGPGPSPFVEFESLHEKEAPPIESLDIGESFEVWKLIPDVMQELASGVRDLEAIARPSGLWHHQVRQDKKAVAYARSKPLGPDPASWSLRKLFRSNLASAIERAVEEVDRRVPDSVEVRLLCISFQQVDAFWFVTNDPAVNDKWNNYLMIIRSPDNLPELEPLKIVSSESFLEVLANRRGGMGLTPHR